MKLADAEHKLQGHLTFQGLRVAVENRKGSIRSGVDKDGKPWRTEMSMPYGYFVGSKGKDGEGVDVFVGDDKEAPNAFVIHQKKHDGSYDEDKVLLGVGSKAEARKKYLAHYNTDKFLGPIHKVPMERLKALLASGKPLEKISVDAFLSELASIGEHV